MLMLQLVAAVPMSRSYLPEPRASIHGAARQRSPTLGAVPLRRALQPQPFGRGTTASDDKAPCTKLVADVAARRAAGLFVTPSYLRDVRCDERGYFQPVQTWESVGTSWCADVNTNEKIDGTEVDWHGPPLRPEACLARANPPPGELRLHSACQTNQNPGAYVQPARGTTRAACDDQCWWDHCRIEDSGYCPTCMDGLTCAGERTVREGFLVGSCEAKDPDPPAQICQDDPDNRLAPTGWNCGAIRRTGICSQDIGFMYSNLLGTDQLIASTVCPLSCNTCPTGVSHMTNSQDPATDSVTSSTTPSGVDPGGEAGMKMASLLSQTEQTVLSGRQVAKAACFGCWSDTTQSCANVMPEELNPDYTSQVESRLARDCEAAGSVWQSPPRPSIGSRKQYTNH